MGSLLALLLGVSFLVGIAIGVLPPLLVPIQEELRLSTLQIGAINSVFGLARMVVAIPTGRYLRRANSVTALVGAILLSIVGSLVMGLGGGYRAILVGRSLVGLGAGIANVVVMTQLFMDFPAGVQGGVVSLYEATRTLSLGVGSLVAGYLGGGLGWRGVFLGAALIAFVALVPASVWALRPPDPGPPPLARRARPASPSTNRENAPTERRPPAARTPGLLPVYGVSFFLAFCWGGVLFTLFPLYGGTSLKLSSHTVGWALTLGYLANVLLLVPVGWWSDRVGRLPMLAGGTGVLALAILLIPHSTGPVVFLGVGALLGAGFSIWAQPSTILVGRSTGLPTSSLVGSYRFANDMGYVAGPLVLSVLATHLGYGTSLRLTALGLALAVFGVVALGRGRKFC